MRNGVITSDDNARYKKYRNRIRADWEAEHPGLSYPDQLGWTEADWEEDHICYDDKGFGVCRFCGSVIPCTPAEGYFARKKR